ncbi:acylphosphatase [Lysobacter humi (ex Lee et al. 2017)]
MSTVRFLVTGRVQGVGFRAATAFEARRLGLRGTVRNLADGRVEVLADGESQAIEAFGDWLREGPDLARVDSVERAPMDPAGLTTASFEIR